MDIVFWQSEIFGVAALTAVASIVSSLTTLIVQIRSTDRRRNSDVARDDRLRDEARDIAAADAAARHTSGLLNRQLDDIDAFIREANRIAARLRVQLLGHPGDRGPELIPSREEWELFHVAMYNAAAAAERLEPSGTLLAAVNAAREVINEYHTTLTSVGNTEPIPPTLDAINGRFVRTMADLRELTDAHRVEST